MSKHLQPIAPNQRVKEIDFVRGIALLGILMVNMAIFRDSIFGMTMENPTAHGLASTIANGLIYLLAEGKFYSLFSLLFGFGFSIFLLKEQQQHIQMESFFKQRMFGLLLFGIIHAFFIWSGDILMTYAVLGLMLIAFKNVSAKGLVKWAVGLVVFIVAIQLLIYWGIDAVKNMPNSDFVLVQLNKVEEVFSQKAAHAREAYSGTNYMAMMGVRVKELGQQYSGFLVVFPSVLSMFLVGFALGKSGKLQDINANKMFFRRMFWITLSIGLPLAALHPYGIFKYSRLAMDLTGSFQIIGFFLGSPLLALAYFSGGLLLFNRFSNQKLLGMVAKAGRMALTNYLLQSIICTSIFYGYGLGLTGKVNAFYGLILTITIWSIQLPLSSWWLSHYHFGPAEWLWRWITYGEKKPNRIKDQLVN